MNLWLYAPMAAIRSAVFPERAEARAACCEDPVKAEAKAACCAAIAKAV